MSNAARVQLARIPGQRAPDRAESSRSCTASMAIQTPPRERPPLAGESTADLFDDALADRVHPRLRLLADDDLLQELAQPEAAPC